MDTDLYRVKKPLSKIGQANMQKVTQKTRDTALYNPVKTNTLKVKRLVQ